MLPGPTNVPARIMNAMLTHMINHRGKDFVNLYVDVIEKTKRIFQTNDDVVVLSASGTGAVEASVINLIKKDDKVLIPVNGEFSNRLSQLLEMQGANTIKLVTPPGENPTIDQIKEVFDNHNDLKAFYVVHNETSTGTQAKYLDKISDLTSRNGCYFVVDSVSLLGGDELPVDKWNIDICVTGSQKTIAAPPGLSMISVNKRTKKYMLENPPPTLYFNLARYFNYYEKSHETPFTPAIPILYAYREALNMILEEGLESRIQRHKICSAALYSSLSEMGFSPFAKEEDRSVSVIALKYIDGIDDKKFRNLLADKFRVLVAGGFGNLKGQVFRVGCMGEVNKYHVMRTISSIYSVLHILGYNVSPTVFQKAHDELKNLETC